MASNLRDPDNDVPLSELLRRFAQDGASLLRQEIALAKLELRESVKGYAKDAGKLGAAAAAGLLGAFALVAFLIIGLGDLINNYWLSALIVSIVFFVVAGILARVALSSIKHNSIAPEETLETLQEDKRWAKQEVTELKRRLKA